MILCPLRYPHLNISWFFEPFLSSFIKHWALPFSKTILFSLWVSISLFEIYSFHDRPKPAFICLFVCLACLHFRDLSEVKAVDGFWLLWRKVRHLFWHLRNNSHFSILFGLPLLHNKHPFNHSTVMQYQCLYALGAGIQKGNSGDDLFVPSPPPCLRSQLRRFKVWGWLNSWGLESSENMLTHIFGTWERRTWRPLLPTGAPSRILPLWLDFLVAWQP